mgnify:CR=1 FL=1
MEEIIIRIENAALKLGKFSIKPAIINIPKGYIVGIQGDNGAGKSTMLRMLLGMYDKMQGNIYIDGIDVVKNRTQIKNITGIVSQERTFFMEEDAYENERLYAPFYKNWNSGEYRKMLKNLNINSGRSLGNLSTGEMLKYQLAFAAATREYVEAGKDQQGKGFDPRKLLAPGFEAIKATVKEKMELFGSIDKA